MDEFAYDLILFDFYSKLLSDRNREVFGAYLEEDLSLTELSERFEMSRQGASDIIKRTRKTLKDYEEKLGLEQKFRLISDELEKIKETADEVGGREGKSISGSVERIREKL